MANDRFMIAPFNSGLQNNLSPWLTPEDSFELFKNAYVFRGKVKKRFGSKLSGTGSGVNAQLTSRLRVALSGAGIGITTADGNATAALPNKVPGTTYATGQMFSIGTQTYSVYQDGLMLATGTLLGTTNVDGDISGTVPGLSFTVGKTFTIGNELFTVVNVGAPGVMTTTGLSTEHTFDTTTGAYVIKGAAASTNLYFYSNLNTYNTTTGEYTFIGADATTQIYFYPAQPVMGFSQYEQDTLFSNPALAFDTQFAYIQSGGAWARLTAGLDPAIIWHGSDADFFWSTNWLGITNNLNSLFISNFYAVNKSGAAAATDDRIRAFDGTNLTEFDTKFLIAGAGNFVLTAKIIIPFKDRLLLLNTIERNDLNSINAQYINRCRFCHNGSPFSASAWYEPNEVGATGGGYIDAPTLESIVSAEFIKDRLIVYFENSTWELAYTHNQILPFVWQKINTELGSESAFSTVAFDKSVLNIGPTGLHACNGINVERIDEKIPDEIFTIRNDNNGVYRVAGIKDYLEELVFWTLPTVSAGEYSDTYPNSILVFNYKNGTWAINDDSITAFGYFEYQSGVTWADLVGTVWEESVETWDSGAAKAQFKQIIAGNQQGFTFVLGNSYSTNAPAMQITNIDPQVGYTDLTIINHNLQDGDFIKIIRCDGTDEAINDANYQVNLRSKDVVRIETDDLITLYNGAGLAARVSRIDIKTKWLNPYINNGKNVAISSVDFAVERTAGGQISVDMLPSSSTVSIYDSSVETGSALGTKVLETHAYTLLATSALEEQQRLLWHRMYFNGEGSFLQLRLFLDDDQLTDVEISESDFGLQAMILYSNPTR